MSWINILGKFKSIVLVQYYIVFSLTLKLALLCWCIEFNVFDKRDILSKFHVLPQTTILGFTVTTSFIFLIHIHVPNIKGMLLVYTLYCMTKGQVKGQNSPCDASLKCVQDIDSTLSLQSIRNIYPNYLFLLDKLDERLKEIFQAQFS